jgi:Rrf2 family protein
MSTMLRISDAASLAMHAMFLMAEEPAKVLSTHEIATKLGVSEAHLAKVMQRLHKAGLLRSVRGPKGGFLPARPAGDVMLLEVYEVIDGPLSPSACLLGKPVCNGAECILGKLLGDVNRQVRSYLASTKLSDLGRKPGIPGEIAPAKA